MVVTAQSLVVQDKAQVQSLWQQFDSSGNGYLEMPGFLVPRCCFCCSAGIWCLVAAFAALLVFGCILVKLISTDTETEINDGSACCTSVHDMLDL